MKRFPFSCLVLLVIAPLCMAQDDMTKEEMVAGVRSNLAAFDLVKLPDDGAPVPFKTRLGETTSTFKEKLVFDGIRFRTPRR
jgi:hypothetical protein